MSNLFSKLIHLNISEKIICNHCFKRIQTKIIKIPNHNTNNRTIHMKFNIKLNKHKQLHYKDFELKQIYSGYYDDEIKDHYVRIINIIDQSKTINNLNKYLSIILQRYNLELYERLILM